MGKNKALHSVMPSAAQGEWEETTVTEKKRKQNRDWTR